MELTIAICTYNREKYLQKTLDALLDLNAVETSYEILVVNNRCTDGTPALLQRYACRFSVPFRVMKEERQGLSHSRNKALKEAAGQLVAFLDDDALPCPDWVSLMKEAMEKVSPPPAVCGGKVVPRFEKDRPAWSSGGKMDVFLFSAVDYGDESRWFRHDEGPVGANIVYRKTVLRELGICFDPDLGRKGKGLWGGEEGEVLRKLRHAGYNAYYVPQASVVHVMSADRLNYRDARHRFYWMGRSHGVRSFFGRSCTLNDYWKSALQFTRTFMRHVPANGHTDADRKKHGLWRWYWAGMALQGWFCLLRKLLPQWSRIHPLRARSQRA